MLIKLMKRDSTLASGLGQSSIRKISNVLTGVTTSKTQVNSTHFIQDTCVFTAGTMGTLVGTTGDITVGTTTLTVNTNTGLSVGDQITIVGVSGIKTITAIVGTTITINSSASATVTGSAVAFYNGVFKTFGSISA